MTEQEAWLLLNKTPGLGSTRINLLLNHFGDVSSIIKTKSFPENLKIPSKSREFLNLNNSIDAIKNDLKLLEHEQNHLLTVNSDLYPPLLKQISSPPPILFVKGNVSNLLMPQIAVVGSRNATSTGKQNCQAFCSHLANSGITITSGLALGIDGEAHQAALNAQGSTLAVMATGLDSVYPSKHRQLAHDIVNQGGALVTEFSSGTKPNSFNFPQRNRLICGLSMGTLVVEAGLKSGSLISARLTMECNRPVLAIPGSIHNPLAKGCHQLIKQGAKLVESAQDILEEMTPMAHSLSQNLQSKLESLDQNIDLSNLSPIEIKVYNSLKYDPLHVDEISQTCNLSSAELSPVLLNLELEGLVNQVSGGCYIKK